MRNVVCTAPVLVYSGTLRLVYSILRLRGTPTPVAQAAIGPTAHLAAPPFPGPGHAGRLPKIQCGPHARVRASLCDPAASLARRCRGGDISRMCLADPNQWICPAAPDPRVTSCAPGPARRACWPFHGFGSHARIHWGTRPLDCAGAEVSAQQPRYLAFGPLCQAQGLIFFACMLATCTASLEPPDAIFDRCARAAYRTPPVAALTGGSGTSVPRQRYLSNLFGGSQPMAVPSRSAPQTDLMHPWARPSSLSRRFTDSDPPSHVRIHWGTRRWSLRRH